MDILICEDEPVLASAIGEMLERILPGNGVHRVTVVCSAWAFEEYLEKNAPPALVLMDIQLGQDNGYTLSAELRQKSLQAEIAYITAFPQHMKDAFPYRPICFVEKPVTEQKLSDLLTVYGQYHPGALNCLRFSVRDSLYVIAADRILYINSEAHKLTLHLNRPDETISFTGKLDEVQAQLASSGFIRCHKSYLVNRGFIRSLNQSTHEFILTDGTRINISRSLYAQAVRQYI